MSNESSLLFQPLQSNNNCGDPSPPMATTATPSATTTTATATSPAAAPLINNENDANICNTAADAAAAAVTVDMRSPNEDILPSTAASEKTRSANNNTNNNNTITNNNNIHNGATSNSPSGKATQSGLSFAQLLKANLPADASAAIAAKTKIPIMSVPGNAVHHTEQGSGEKKKQKSTGGGAGANGGAKKEGKNGVVSGAASGPKSKKTAAKEVGKLAVSPVVKPKVSPLPTPPNGSSVASSASDCGASATSGTEADDVQEGSVASSPSVKSAVSEKRFASPPAVNVWQVRKEAMATKQPSEEKVAAGAWPSITEGRPTTPENEEGIASSTATASPQNDDQNCLLESAPADTSAKMDGSMVTPASSPAPAAHEEDSITGSLGRRVASAPFQPQQQPQQQPSAGVAGVASAAGAAGAASTSSSHAAGSQTTRRKSGGDTSMTSTGSAGSIYPTPTNSSASRGRGRGRGGRHASSGFSQRGFYQQNRNAAVMSPVSPQGYYPYVPVMDVETVKFYVLGQVEYYFSVENLCRDIYFRKQMNEEGGWVSLDTIAGFNRIRALTNDKNMIKEAVQHSTVLEVGENAVRRKDDWERWVLPAEQIASMNAAEEAMAAAQTVQATKEAVAQ